MDEGIGKTDRKVNEDKGKKKMIKERESRIDRLAI